MRDGGGVVVVAPHEDLEALAVLVALRRSGAEADLVDTRWMPSRLRCSFRVSGSAALCRSWRFGTTGVPVQPRSVWKRFWLPPEIPAEVAPEDRDFASAECAEVVRTLILDLERSGVVVNREAARLRARRKVTQLAAARGVGLSIPATLVSNDPEDVRAFLRSVPRAVYKTLTQSSMIWNEGTSRYVAYATPVDEGTLVGDRMLTMVPGIFQELVDSRFALRVTVVGDSVFAARVDWDTEDQGIDWRLAGRERLTIRPYAVQTGLEERLQAFMKELGLEFGVCDLLVRPDGEIVFLEVNETGRFLFVQDATGLPLLEALVDLLSGLRTGRPAKPRFDLKRLYREAETVAEEIARDLQAERAGGAQLTATRRSGPGHAAEGSGREAATITEE